MTHAKGVFRRYVLLTLFFCCTLLQPAIPKLLRLFEVSYPKIHTLAVLVSLLPMVLGAMITPELFSPLIPQKILATFESLPNPAMYPQYTDRTVGDLQFFVPDLWTPGFFPATGYALNTRTKKLCGATPQNKLGVAD
ncbi:hypothetical protein AN958_02237 [Leucoagaricus sp. SymC.cos]|nr:hypothetical protein AN958_02237 [Leucoagaricus sp. SymC.cos]